MTLMMALTLTKNIHKESSNITVLRVSAHFHHFSELFLLKLKTSFTISLTHWQSSKKNSNGSPGMALTCMECSSWGRNIYIYMAKQDNRHWLSFLTHDVKQEPQALTKSTLVLKWDSGDLKRNLPHVSSRVHAISIWWWEKSDRSICNNNNDEKPQRQHFNPIRERKYYTSNRCYQLKKCQYKNNS